MELGPGPVQGWRVVMMTLTDAWAAGPGPWGEGDPERVPLASGGCVCVLTREWMSMYQCVHKYV